MVGRGKKPGLGRQRRFGRGLTVVKHLAAAAGNGHTGLGGSAVQRAQKIRVQQVVGIAKGEPPRAVGAGSLYAGQPCGCRAPVALVNHHKAPVPGGNVVTQGGGLIGGTVVHQNADKVRKALRGNGFHAGGQVGCAVENRHDHGNFGAAHGVTSLYRRR